VTPTPDRSHPTPSGAPEADPSTAVAELRVEGMHCGSCVALVEESLRELTGVASASVDLESSRAVVAYDPARVGPDELRAAVAEVGYTAAMIG
jgi:copper chaperone CopZ